MEKIIDDKKITCGIVIINKDGDILACHPNGNKKDMDYDIPKGCAEEDEEDIQAALRELNEETSIILKESNLIDCGVYPHNKTKNIHIYLYKTEKFPILEDLKCTSLCTKWGGYQVPEVNYYSIIKKNERNKFMRVLQNKFDIIDKFNK